ncbi:MAG TPA: hypothetical protein VF766_02530 [Pyrinomonadaceae bacterium]
MKLLIIFGVLAFIFLLIYLRLRPYIRMARQMFGVARGVRGAMRQEPAAAATTNRAGNKLVRCDACGTWSPSSRALRLRSSSASYCSHACLESAAEGSKRKAAG